MKEKANETTMKKNIFEVSTINWTNDGGVMLHPGNK